MTNTMLRLHLQICLLTFLTSICKPTTAFKDSLPWPNAASLLQMVCPFERICGIPPRGSDIRNSCCTGCSCEEDCSITGRCCFLSNPVTKEETCMFLRTKFTYTHAHFTSKSLTQAYYVVSSKPRGGCLDGNDLRDTVKVDDKSLIAPVYSPVTGKIYINIDLALCHGVVDLIEMESALVCDGLENSSTELEFDKEITNYLRNRSSSACFMTFYIYGQRGIAKRKCVIDDVNFTVANTKETVDKTIDPVLNMSLEAIFDACKSNFYAPVVSNNTWYSNAFCYVYAERTIDSPVCRTTSDNVLGIEYLALLSPSVQKILQSKDTEQRSPIAEACLTQDVLLKPQFLRCKLVSCPFGHVRDLEGNCIFYGSTIYFRSKTSISVYLLLRRSKEDSSIDEAPQAVTFTVTDVENALELPPEWVLTMLAIPSAPSNTDNTINGPDELLVRLQALTSSSIEALNSLKRYIYKTIVLGNGSVTHQYTMLVYPLSLPFTRTDELLETDSYCSGDTFAVLSDKEQQSPSSGNNSGIFPGNSNQIIKKGKAFSNMIKSSEDIQPPVLDSNGKSSTEGLNQETVTKGTDADPQSKDEQTVDYFLSKDKDSFPLLKDDGNGHIPALNTASPEAESNLNEPHTVHNQEELSVPDFNENSDVIKKVDETPNTDHLVDTTGRRYLPTCWKVLHANFRVNSPSIDTNKMYFCDTVELMPGEFRLMADDTVLFNEIRRIYLYSKEFIVLSNGNVNKTVKICLEDSGFERRLTNGVGVSQGLHVDVTIFIIITITMSAVALNYT